MMSVKKKVSTRQSVKVKAEAPRSTQPVGERRSAEAQLRLLITKFAPKQLRLISAMRRSLRKCLLTAHEVVYEYRDCFVVSFSPSEHGYEGILAIRGSKNDVRLYFNRGKHLPDPEKLLQGSSGAQTRFISIASASTLALPAVATLIKEAIAQNRVPFPPVDRGSIVIRSTVAKKTRRQTTTK